MRRKPFARPEPPDGCRWTILGFAGQNDSGATLWKCQCVCGTVALVIGKNLNSGVSRQCRQCADQSKLIGTRSCDWCKVKYTARTSRSRFCSDACRQKSRWSQVRIDPKRKAAHNRRSCQHYKDSTHIKLTCEHCGIAFVGPPQRKHCSRECLEEVIRSGKYRDQFNQRQAEQELADLTAKLQQRDSND